MLDHLDSGQPCNLVVIAANRQANTGGDEMVFKAAKKYIQKPKVHELLQPKESSGKESKNPNHFYNSTRNILLPNSEIKTIHIRLIIEFNGKQVM